MKTSTEAQVFEFCWKVDAAGYEWGKGVGSKPHLFACNVPGKGMLIYKPMKKNPGLFRDFSELDGKEKIRDFATQYGLLFDRYSDGDLREEQVGYRSVESAFGISLARWQHEIGDMRALVAFWDSIVGSKLPDLRRIITWKNGGVQYELSTPKALSSRWLVLPEATHRYKGGDVLLPAQDALQQEINKRLSGEIDRISPGRLQRIECVPQLICTPDGHQQLTLAPPNLLGAMWLQFALVVAGAYQLRRCAACGKYFQVGKGVQRRADAITCSDACRQRKKRQNL